MTNKEIKKYKGVFKKLKIPIYIENFFLSTTNHSKFGILD